MISEFQTIYLICGGLSLILAMMVVGRNLRFRDGVYFFLFVMMQAFWIGALYFGYFFLGEVWRPDLSIVFIKLAYAFGLLMVLFLAFFFVYFPRMELSVAKWLRGVILVVSLVMAFVAATTDLVHARQVFVDGVYVADELGSWYLAYMLLVCLLFGLGFYFSLAKLRLVAGVRRQKVFLSAVCAWIFLVLAFTCNVLLPFFQVYLPIAWLTVLFSFVFTVPTFFAFRQYRFFKVSYFLYRLMAVIFFVGLFSVVFLAAWMNLFLAVVWGFLLAVAMHFLWPFFESRDFRRLREGMMDLKLKVLFVDDLESLSRCLEDFFGYEEVRLLLCSRSEVDRRLGNLGLSAIVYEEILFRDFSPKRRDFLLEEFKKLRANVCLPLFVNEEFLGVLVLGKNLDRRTLAIEEVKLFEELARVLELTVANILVRSEERGSRNFLKSIVRKQTRVLSDLLSRQSDFLATTAHEFRTPLNIAIFQLEDAMSNYRDHEGLVEDMKSLESSLMTLKDLTQRLFDFQRYDLDKVVLRKERTEISEFFGQICEEFGPLMKKRKKFFQFRNLLADQQFAEFDSLQMRQVVSNLLSNAMKFASRIEAVLMIEGDKVCFAVIDNGCGVADDFKQRIFEKFQSGSGKMPDSYGLGMGLFIARRIMELHGGRIVLEDSPGGGATFKIYL